VLFADVNVEWTSELVLIVDDFVLCLTMSCGNPVYKKSRVSTYEEFTRLIKLNLNVEIVLFMMVVVVVVVVV